MFVCVIRKLISSLILFCCGVAVFACMTRDALGCTEVGHPEKMALFLCPGEVVLERCPWKVGFCCPEELSWNGALESCPGKVERCPGKLSWKIVSLKLGLVPWEVPLSANSSSSQ